MPRQLVHAAALEALRGLFSDPVFLLEAAARHQTRLRAEAVSRASPGSTEGVSERIATLRQELDALLLEQVRAQTPEARASVARVRERHEAEINRLQQQIGHQQREAAAAVDLERLLPLLPVMAERFDVAWGEAEDTERRAVTAALIARIPCRIERTESRRPYRREVGPMEWAAWLERGR